MEIFGFIIVLIIGVTIGYCLGKYMDRERFKQDLASTTEQVQAKFSRNKITKIKFK